jgi:hypothetical protein
VRIGIDVVPHDRRWLNRAKQKILQIETDIETLQEFMRPTLRRSYKFETFIEGLLFGRKKAKHNF